MTKVAWRRSGGRVGGVRAGVVVENCRLLCQICG